MNISNGTLQRLFVHFYVVFDSYIHIKLNIIQFRVLVTPYNKEFRVLVTPYNKEMPS